MEHFEEQIAGIRLKRKPEDSSEFTECELLVKKKHKNVD